MSKSKRAFVGAALFAIALHAGCEESAHSPGEVYGRATLNSLATQTLITAGSLVAVDGVYGDDCQYRSTSGSFRLPINDYRDNPAGAELAVQYGDSDCTLMLTHIEAIEPFATPRLYAIDPVRPLSQLYQDSAARCSLPGQPPPFFLNARLRSSAGALFDSDFIIELIYSDDPLRLDQVVQVQYATVRAVVQAMGVPTPDYLIDTAGLSLRVDARGLLAAGTSGQISLQANKHEAQQYVVTAVDPGSTATSLSATYEAGNPIPISGTSLSIPASDFGLTAGNALPVNRFLILASYLPADPATRSYQVFALHFRAP